MLIIISAGASTEPSWISSALEGISIVTRICAEVQVISLKTPCLIGEPVR